MDLTPCGAAYQCIGAFIDSKRYEEIDDRIISKSFLDDKGRSPYDRIQTTKTYRTREIIQKDPHILDPRTFCDIYEASRNLIAYFKHIKRSNVEICSYFSGQGARVLTKALVDHGYDARVFQNTMEDLTRCNDPSRLDSATAIMMLFLAFAFYCDSREAFPLFTKITKRYGIGVDMQTGVLAEEETVNNTVDQTYALLGLQRIYDDGRRGQMVYRLNPGSEGTIIGRAAPAEFCINDVDSSVSRKHLLIYRDNVTWMAQGQGSTNGSSLLRGDGACAVIEKGKGKSRRTIIEPPIAIQPGDILTLGFGTRFEVVLLGYADGAE